jgi:hypothetical protein
LTPDEAKTLTEAQTLIYGGVISLTTAILVVLLQTLFQERRERYLERRATRERFSAYDLEKLNQVEAALIEYRDSAKRGRRPDKANQRLNDLVMVSAPNIKARSELSGALYEMTAPMRRLIKAYQDFNDENLAAESLEGEVPYLLACAALEDRIVDFLRVFRVEVLGEEKDLAVKEDADEKSNVFSDYIDGTKS